MLSHEIITNELRKLRNDMLFLKANLFYPEDIDHGPTEEMISVDGITIPDYVKVIKVPDTATSTSPEYQKYSLVMHDIDLYLENLEAKDLRAYQFITDFDKYISPENARLLVWGQMILERALALIPKNFNYFLRKFFACVTQLQINYTIISRVNTYLDGFDYIEPINICKCLTNNSVSTVEQWVKYTDTMLEDGMFTITFDDVIANLKDSVTILNKEQAILNQLNKAASASKYTTHTELLVEVCNAISASIKIDSKDWHMERSKVPFVSFDKKLPNIESYTPELPYKYVHGDYLCNYTRADIYTPTSDDETEGLKPLKAIRVSDKIGDFIELP